MSTIIKATDRDAGIHGVAFNFDDMASKANQYLQKVRADATQIVIQAKEEGKKAYEQAKREGEQAGKQAVGEMVRKQLNEQLVTLKPALQQVVGELRHARQAWMKQWEKSTVHLAASIASRVIRRELSQTPEITLDLVREALELALNSPHLRIHLNPTDHQALAQGVDLLTKELSGLGDVEIIASPAITPGGCRVETQFGLIDQQIETQLARIEEELT